MPGRYQSQIRAAAAIENHLFDEQIVPIEVKTKKGITNSDGG